MFTQVLVLSLLSLPSHPYFGHLFLPISLLILAITALGSVPNFYNHEELIKNGLQDPHKL